MVKKRLPKAIASAVIVSLYYGAKMKVRVGSELSKKFWVQIGVHQLMLDASGFCNCGESNYDLYKRRPDERNF